MALKAALDSESARLLIDSKIQDAVVVQLRLQKARTNLAHALQTDPAADYVEIEDRLLSVEYNAASRDEAPRNTDARPHGDGARGEPGDKPGDKPAVLDELNMLSSEMQLRRHRPDKLEAHSVHQEQLSADLVDMAQTIKRNAQLFQKKLESDSDLVSTTTDALSRTAGSMSSVGQRLQQYRRETQLGWMFYIYSTLFILFSLFFGMTLIQLFGKW